MVPTGSASTPLCNAYLKSPKMAPPSPYVNVYPIRNHCIEQTMTERMAGMIAASELDRVVYPLYAMPTAGMIPQPCLLANGPIAMRRELTED